MKKLFVIVMMVLGAAGMTDAQTLISKESINHDADSVTVSFEVDTDKTEISTRYKEVILPFIYNDRDTLFLDVIEVYGKGRFNRERQVNAINGDKHWELGKNQMMRNEGVYVYESSVPLKRWMKVANLGIRRKIVGCACENDLKDEDIAQANLFEEPQVSRRMPEYVLAPAMRQWDFGQDELEIIFKVSKVEIDSSVFDNEVTFGKILSAVDKIFANPHYKMDKIEVEGYASPEGRPGFNSWLGQNRALALIDYIIKSRPQYNLTRDDFRIRNGEENWTGLRKLLMESDIENKDKVIAIIDDESIPNTLKKDKIKWMDHGKTWKKMLDSLYPHLRSARYLAVYYDSTDDKAVDIINNANAMIDDGKYAEAYEQLQPVADDMRAFNSIGVALMIQGKFEEAMPWFEKALEGNCPSAQKNIDAINAEYAHEAQQRREIEEFLKKYE